MNLPASRLLLLLAVNFCASGAFSVAAPAPPSPDPSAPQWIDRLRADANGDPLLLVLTKKGALVGRSASGKAEAELLGASKQPREALLDGARELVWLREAGRLMVIDLRSKTPTPYLIAQGLPKPAPFEITSGSEGEEKTLERPSACEPEGRVQLKWSSSPDLEISVDGPSKGKLVGAKWLKDNFARAAAVAPALVDFWTVEEPEQITLPKGVSKCIGAEPCSVALPFGDAGWRLVLTKVEEGGDCRHLSCLLFDPTTKAFATPTSPDTWKAARHIRRGSCGPFYFDKSGRLYVTDHFLCSVGPEGRCSDIDGTALGWLPPGAAIGAPG